MEWHVTSIWLSVAFVLGVGQVQPEAIPAADVCMERGPIFHPYVQKPMQLKLAFESPRAQLLRDSTLAAASPARPRSNPTTTGKKRVREERAEQEELEVQGRNQDSMDYSDADDEDKLLLDHVDCLVSLVCENIKLLSNDAKVLRSTITQAKGAANGVPFSAMRKFKTSSAGAQPKKLKDVVIQRDDKSSVVDNTLSSVARADHQQPGLAAEAETEPETELEDEPEAEPEAHTEAHREAKPVARAIDGTIQEHILPSTDLTGPPYNYLPPPLFQLLGQRSAVPWSLKQGDMEASRRYLHTADELRLARTVQAAPAASGQQLDAQDKQHVEQFKENLRRLVSNQAAIEQRVSSLLAGIEKG